MTKRIKMKGPIPNNSQEAYDYFGLEAVGANLSQMLSGRQWRHRFGS